MTSLSRNEYFQDILNRMVVTVMFGMMTPLQGAELVHGCATVLGLDLIEQPPETTLVITGMRKTNDLSQGHNFIVKAFKTFGNIEEAAIAPNNRGFGESPPIIQWIQCLLARNSLTSPLSPPQAWFVSRTRNPSRERSKSTGNSK